MWSQAYNLCCCRTDCCLCCLCCCWRGFSSGQCPDLDSLSTCYSMIFSLRPLLPDIRLSCTARCSLRQRRRWVSRRAMILRRKRMLPSGRECLSIRSERSVLLCLSLYFCSPLSGKLQFLCIAGARTSSPQSRGSAGCSGLR